MWFGGLHYGLAFMVTRNPVLRSNLEVRWLFSLFAVVPRKSQAEKEFYFVPNALILIRRAMNMDSHKASIWGATLTRNLTKCPTCV